MIEFLGVLTVVISGATFYIQWRKYRREHDHNAVWTSGSVATFKKSIEFCETVKIGLNNLSKYPTVLAVKVSTEGLFLHFNQGTNHQSCYKQLNLPEWTIAPNGTYEYTFNVHVCKSRPKRACIKVHVNGRLWRKVEYNYNETRRKYFSSA